MYNNAYTPSALRYCSGNNWNAANMPIRLNTRIPSERRRRKEGFDDGIGMPTHTLVIHQHEELTHLFMDCVRI